MFVMNPVFVVTPTENWRMEPFKPPHMAVVEEILRVVDGDSYLCRLTVLPGLPTRWCEAFVRLDGVCVPDSADPDFNDKVRAEVVKDFVALRILGARQVMLRDFRRDKSGRLLANVHIDHCDLSALLAELVQ